MRRSLKLAAVFLMAIGLSGLGGCIVVPGDGYYGGYHHHHRDRGGDRDWR